MPDQLFFDIVKMVVALAFIVGLIYGVVYVLKRLLPGGGAPGGDKPTLQLLSQLAVGSRQRIAVLRVQDRTLVVGITEGSINTLAELTPPAAAAKKEADDPKIFEELLSWPKDGGQPGKTPAPGPGRSVRDPGACRQPEPAADSLLRLRPISDAVPEAEERLSRLRQERDAREVRDDGPLLFAPGERPPR